MVVCFLKKAGSVLLVAVVIVVGALSFFPALALGPVAEHLQMTR